MPDPIVTTGADGGSPSAPGSAVTPSASEPVACAETPMPAGCGRYEFIEELAHGGMGVVFRATDTTLGREVAVKVLKGRYAADSAAARRFVDEARVTGQPEERGAWDALWAEVRTTRDEALKPPPPPATAP
jgi:hypothetical protein